MSEGSPPESPDVARPPLALVKWLLVGLVLAALFVLWGIPRRYFPLQPGTASLAPESAQFVPSSNYPTVPGAYLVQYVSGGTVTFGFSIRNSGRFGVTITSIGGPKDGGMLSNFVYRRTDAAFTMDQGPIAPFALPGGKETWIRVSASFANCQSYPALATVIYDHVLVHYRIILETKLDNVALNFKVIVMSPDDSNCPGRG